jgi:hypothetical protein
MTVHWDYTTVLNILALAVAAGLLYRFVRTGGLPMLKMMGGSPDGTHDHHTEQAHSQPSAARESSA